ncbi:MAG: hypothetical protein IKP91_09065 [Bacteroidaceae bacterium]|nr:hypothetical protein [Bacteroidaceae bacterium]
MLLVAKNAKIAHFIGENPVFSFAYFSCSEACSARSEACSIYSDACSVFSETYSAKIPQAGTFIP